MYIGFCLLALLFLYSIDHNLRELGKIIEKIKED